LQFNPFLFGSPFFSFFLFVSFFAYFLALSLFLTDLQFKVPITSSFGLKESFTSQLAVKSAKPSQAWMIC